MNPGNQSLSENKGNVRDKQEKGRKLGRGGARDIVPECQMDNPESVKGDNKI